MDELDPAQRLNADALGEAYHRRYGAAVEWVKAEVGAGEEYGNATAHAVVSPNGAWCEAIDLPMEFTGMAGGAVPHWFLETDRAIDVADGLYTLAQAGGDNSAVRSLFVLYTRAGIVDARGVYSLHHSGHPGDPGRRTRRVGRFRSGELPAFFRCRLDAPVDVGPVRLDRGGAFFIALAEEKHLLVGLPHVDVELVDLGAVHPGPSPQ